MMTVMQNQSLSEQEQIRRAKLAEMIMMGIDPYPAPLYPVNNYAANIKDKFTDETKDDPMAIGFSDVCVADLVMSVRYMGKADFSVLQDYTGSIQLYIRRTDSCTSAD